MMHFHILTLTPQFCDCIYGLLLLTFYHLANGVYHAGVRRDLSWWE